jgi:Uma2 family endonuclease
MSVTIAISENPPVTIPDRVTSSLAAFREWAGNNDLPENAKVFYYRGEVWIEMGKEQLFTHVEVKTEITTVLRTLAKSQRLGRVWGEGVLLTHEKAKLSGNPDMIFLSAATLGSDRVSLTEGAEGGYVEVVGTADMVLEVVSDSSERNDNQTLFEAYYEAGIPEYWLVDARGKEVEFTIYKHSGKKYTATRAQSGGWVKSVVFGKSFRLVRGTDASGNPEFTLEVK